MTDTAIKLYGTTQTGLAHRLLRAGHLTATLEGGDLRWIRWRGVEIARGLFFLVRNAGWGTPAIAIHDLDVKATETSFAISYRGIVVDGGGRLTIGVTIAGRASGDIVARAEVVPATDFVTNRTGFVILHPIEGFAGVTAEVDHAEGGPEATQIPALISPGQPVRDIRGLRYSPREDVSVDFRFEGEVFEMEDQRNWTDASFKTYSRPLDRPRPYTLEAGIPVSQTVRITVRETVSSEQPTAAADVPVAVAIGALTEGRLPQIGLALPSELAETALAHADLLRRLGADHLAARFDLSDPDRGSLDDIARLSARTALPVTLDILLTTETDPRPEIAAVASDAREAGLYPRAVGAFAKIDERSFQPGEKRPPSSQPEDIHRALRSAFPDAVVTGGTPAFFTELNRKRPPAEGYDQIAHGTCATVHAADDASVMETLQSLPWIIRTTRDFGGDRPIRLGPVAIGARINPYGNGPEQNPGNGRVGLAGVDPRQRGLFGAAWHVGYAAAAAPHGIDSLVLAAPTGAFGLVHGPQSHAQPWFDALDRSAVFPLFHAVADLARGGGKRRIDTDVSDPTRVAALAFQDGENAVLLLANLTVEPQAVSLAGKPGHGLIRVLDEASFTEATLEPQTFSDRGEPFDDDRLRLAPYAVARLTFPGRGT